MMNDTTMKSKELINLPTNFHSDDASSKKTTLGCEVMLGDMTDKTLITKNTNTMLTLIQTSYNEMNIDKDENQHVITNQLSQLVQKSSPSSEMGTHTDSLNEKNAGNSKKNPGSLEKNANIEMKLDNIDPQMKNQHQDKHSKEIEQCTDTKNKKEKNNIEMKLDIKDSDIDDQNEHTHPKKTEQQTDPQNKRKENNDAQTRIIENVLRKQKNEERRTKMRISSKRMWKKKKFLCTRQKSKRYQTKKVTMKKPKRNSGILNDAVQDMDDIEFTEKVDDATVSQHVSDIEDDDATITNAEDENNSISQSPTSNATKNDNEDKNDSKPQSLVVNTGKDGDTEHFVSVNTVWNDRMKDLLEFHKKEGHFNVPHRYTPNSKLGSWVQTQRNLYKRYLYKHLFKFGEVNSFQVQCLDPDSLLGDECPHGKELVKDQIKRLKILDKMGFVWKVHSDWDEQFQKLVQFKKTHGHTCVPMNYPPDKRFGTWLCKQKNMLKKFMDGKKSTITPERKAALDAIGLDDRWTMHYKELLEFWKKNGHCNVSLRSPEKRLAEWVNVQRYNYRRMLDKQQHYLTEDRINALDKLQFYEKN